MTIPKAVQFEAYFNTDWQVLITVTDKQEEEVDLSVFEHITLNIFTESNQFSPEFTLEAGINGNEMLFSLTKEKVNTLFQKVFFHELRAVLADGTEIAWLNGRFVCRNVPNSASQNDVQIVLNEQSYAIEANGLFSVAKAVQAKVDAEGFRDEAETAATNAATSEGNASDSADSASNSATTATEQAGIATAKANEASASATTAGQAANVKDRDRSHFLPLHAKIGWQDDNGQFWHITATDLVRFIQDAISYPTAPVWVIWDGSADPTMTVEPFNI